MTDQDNYESWPLDWTNLLHVSHTFSLEDLSHFRAAHLDHYVFNLAKVVSSRCGISSKGRQHILNNLSTQLDLDLHYVLDDLISSDAGVAFLGLLGIFSSYFSDGDMGSIFVTLAKRTDLPSSYIAPAMDWEHMAATCAVMLSTSAFMAPANKCTRLCEENRDRDQATPTHVNPYVVVDMLWVFTELCDGTQTGPILCFAGKEAGWASAIAESLFDLKIQLRAFLDGPILYSNCAESQCQIQIHFQDPGVRCDGVTFDFPPLFTRSPRNT